MSVPLINTVANLPAGVTWKYRPAPRISGAIFAKCEGDVTFLVPMPVLTSFLQIVGGGVSGAKGSTQWVVPLQHPLFPWLIASRIGGEAVGWDGHSTAVFNSAVVNGGAGFYSHMVVDVHFETPQWALSGGDAFLTINGRPSGRSMAVPASAGTLTDGTHPAHDPGIWVPGFTYDITVHSLPYIDPTGWLTYLPAVNSVAFRGVPAGQVLYNAPAFTSTKTFLGVQSYEVTHSFEVSAIPWNQEFGMNGNPQEWKPNGNDRYNALDLNQLLQGF